MARESRTIEESSNKLSPRTKQSKPSVIKPKPSLKPKPSVKPKPIGQHAATLPRPTNQQAQSNLHATLASSPDLKSISSTTCDQNTPAQSLPMKADSRTPPKRPSSGPRVPVFGTNSALKTSTNLDDIIAGQMQVAKDEASTRMRATSVNSDPRTPPPIPDRKYLPMTRSVSTDAKPRDSANDNATTRVTSSTFYVNSDFAFNVVSNNHHESPRTQLPPAVTVQSDHVMTSGGVHGGGSGSPSEHPVPVPRRRAPPRPAAPLKASSSNLIEFSPEKPVTGLL